MTADTSAADDSSPGVLGSLLSGVRFGQFASVGIVGAAFDFTVLLGLTSAFGVPREIAKLLAIETAILVMFSINERWTFASEGQTGLRPTARRLGRSHGVRAAGSLTQFSVFVGLIWTFSPTIELFGLGLWLPVANAMAIGSGVLLNYTFESLWTWQVHVEE